MKKKQTTIKKHAEPLQITNNMRTLTIIDVETYDQKDIDFMKSATKGMSGENYLLDMAAFMKLLTTTVNKEKIEGFICKLKQMNMA